MYYKKEIIKEYYDSLMYIIESMNYYKIVELKSYNNIFSNNYNDINLTELFNLEKNKNYVIIGAPPFAHYNNIYLIYFNYISKYAYIIAFILPIKFKFNKKINKNFELIYNYNSDKTQNTYEFQIWIKK